MTVKEAPKFEYVYVECKDQIHKQVIRVGFFHRSLSSNDAEWHFKPQRAKINEHYFVGDKLWTEADGVLTFPTLDWNAISNRQRLTIRCECGLNLITRKVSLTDLLNKLVSNNVIKIDFKNLITLVSS